MSQNSYYKTEQVYYQTPKKYVLVYGKDPEAQRLQKLLSKYFAKNLPSYDFSYTEDLNLPLLSNKPKFMDRAYNPDKSLTNNMRFGMIHLSFLLKYLQQKPCILIFVLNTENKRFNEYINEVFETYRRNEGFIKKNRIKCLFVIYNTFQRNEEERTIIKNVFDTPNKNILVSRTSNYDDCFKDIETFIRNYSATFYQNKILKYKDNLLVGNPDNLRFKEYYVRNLTKIAYMNLFLDEAKKALKYFDKSCRMSLDLLRNYKQYCEQNINIGDMEALMRFFYYIQKCEELKRVANLFKTWVIFLKLREKEIAFFELFKNCYQHLSEFDGLDVWYLTPFIHFGDLWKIDFLRIFLYFYYNNVKSQDLYPRLNIFILIKDLMSLCREFFSSLSLPLKNEEVDVEPTSLGIMLYSESHNLEKSELAAINSRLMQSYAVFEQRRQNFERIETLINKTIETNYDAKIARSINIILLLKTDFVKGITEPGSQNENIVIVDPSFRHYNGVYQKILKTIQEGQSGIEFAIKEMIEFNKVDKDLLNQIAEDEAHHQINIEMSSKGFSLLKVFRDSEIDNYGHIYLRLELKVQNPSLLGAISSVELKFDIDYYDNSFSDIKVEGDVLIIDGQLSNNNPNFSQGFLWLKGMNLVIKDKIFLVLGANVAVSKEILKLKINKKSPLKLETDLNQTYYLNNEYFSVEFKINQNLPNADDYKIGDISLRFNVHNSKKLLKSVKIYNKAQQQRVLSPDVILNDDNIAVAGDMEKHIEKLVAASHPSQKKLERDLEQLNKDKTLASDKFMILGSFHDQVQAVKKYFMKIKLTMDSDIEIDWIVSCNISSKDLKIQREETIVLKSRLKIRCAFFISKNQQTLQQDLILKSNEKINDKKVQIDSDCYLNFYLKANHDMVMIDSFEFLPGPSTKVVQAVNPFEATSIPLNEGTNLGLIFRISEVLNSYNIGDLYIKWKRESSEYFTRTIFKDLLIVNTYEIPFSLDVNCPQRAFSGQKLCLRYVISNNSQKQLKFFVTMSSNSNMFVAGMTKNLIDLRPKENKEVVSFVVCNQIGVLALPEFDVFVADLKDTYRVKSLKSIYVTYDYKEDFI